MILVSIIGLEIHGVNMGNIKVESDSNPDLVMRYKPTNEKFAIECKFRSEIKQGAIRFDLRYK